MPEPQPAPKTYRQRHPPSRNSKYRHFIRPMLAKLHEGAFDGDEWVFEIKWDGYRAIAEVDNGKVRLYSRNGLSFESDYPPIYEALKDIAQKGLVLDGEIVALDSEGIPRFQLLQQYEHAPHAQLCYCVFDCLKVKGRSIEDKPLLERKAMLRALLPESNAIRYCDHVAGRGKDFFAAIKAKGLEGMIAKLADSTYQQDARSNAWLKVKNVVMEEAVIAGYTAPRGGRKFFGALVLGVYKNGQLTYVGHTGTGFNDRLLKELYGQLQQLKTDKSPFAAKVPVNAPVTWVSPQLVCNIKYSEITESGTRRHPVFIGLRIDKAARDVHEEESDEDGPQAGITKTHAMKKTATKERPQPAKTVKGTGKTAGTQKEASIANAQETPAGATGPKKQARAGKKPAKEPAKTKDVPRASLEMEDIAVSDKEQVIDGKTLTFTNTDKVFWPAEGYTKGDLINYYNAVYPYIIPYLKDRPESLLRTPNGILSPGFFHKDAGDNAPGWVKKWEMFSESAEKDINYIVCNDRPTLLYLANLGCIEINPWCSRLKTIDKPDYLVLDIDPSEKNTFEQVIETANVIGGILSSAGADAYPKTSGATGLHIYVPLGAKYSYEQAKNFAHLVAMMAHEQLPEFTSLERSLSKRGKNKIYIDFLQNRRGQTLAAPYSLRPKPGATVSTPLEWKEVKTGLHPSQFDITNTLARIAKKGDLFAGVLKKGIDLKKCISNLGG